MKTEDWQRAGFVERNGKMERIENAKGLVRSGDSADKDRTGVTEDSSPSEFAEPEDGAAPELSHAKFQELKKVDNEAAEREAFEKAAAHYIPRVSKVDGESRGQFRITVVFHVSDRRRRDPTGAFETICDVITATVRRLNERLAGRFVEKKQRLTRRRRGNNHNRAIVDFDNPPF